MSRRICLSEMRSLRLALLLAAALSVPALQARAALPSRTSGERSPNVKIIRHYPFLEGNDIDLDEEGGLLYVSRWQHDTGGVYIVDATTDPPAKLGFVKCPGYENDVAALGKGLIALGTEYTACNGGDGTRGGVQMIDTRNPSRPRFLDRLELPAQGAHTITAYPGKPLIYVSPGGNTLYNRRNAGIHRILDASDPQRVEIAAEFKSSAPAGCHDITFHVTARDALAVCVGEAATEIWDVSDPLIPKVVSVIPAPMMQLPHTAAVSTDGNLLAVGDETYVTGGCTRTEASGMIWLYDISDPARPTVVGAFRPSRGQVSATWPWCTPHNFNFIPGTKTLVAAWFSGGTTVTDLSDPSSPAEVAFYAPPDGIAMASYWFRGSVFIADRMRGLEIIRITDLRR